MKEKTETTVQRNLFEALNSRLNPGQSVSELENGFNFGYGIGQGNCELEGKLSYTLPLGNSLTHKSDILVSLPKYRYISIEIKHKSSVDDQFKCRSYDMIQLKNTYQGRIQGVMIYLHVPTYGCSIEKAQIICYPFHYFITSSIMVEEPKVFISRCAERISTIIKEFPNLE